MGQYYTVVNLDDRSYMFPHDYNSGLKLMEHAYLNNELVMSVVEKLSNDWYGHRIVWAGDYADPGLFMEDFVDEYDEHEIKSSTLYKFSRERFKSYEYEREPEKINERFPIISCLDLKEYIDIRNIPKKDSGLTIHPLPLLTAVGNGRGSGDYVPKNLYESIERINQLRHRLNELEKSYRFVEYEETLKEIQDLEKSIVDPSKYIGRWAGKRIAASSEPLNGFTEIRPNFS